MAIGNKKTQIFGILNLTPDSFSDGRENFMDTEANLQKAIELYMAGANVIDIGAESTRPGAAEIDSDTELERVLPFLEKLRKHMKIPISLDTRRSKVAEEVLSEFEIEYINDVSGLQGDLDMARVISENSDDSKVIIMHSKGGIPALKTKDVPDNFYPEGLFNHMKDFFNKSLDIAREAGLEKERLILDPGLGFGKSVQDNMDVVDLIPKLKSEFGLPILIGASRKSFLSILNKETDPCKLEAYTAAYNTLAINNGADIVRIHDLKYHADLLRQADKLSLVQC